MSGFIDRVSTGTTQKKFEVVKLEYDNNDDLIELVVNELRNDSATTEGTKFKKLDMEKAVRDTIYSQVFGIVFSDGTSDVTIVGRESKTKTINTSFFLENTQSSIYNISSSSSSYTFSVPSSVTIASDIEYKIKVYLDENHEYFLFNITGVIHYTPSSTSSND